MILFNWFVYPDKLKLHKSEETEILYDIKYTPLDEEVVLVPIDNRSVVVDVKEYLTNKKQELSICKSIIQDLNFYHWLTNIPSMIVFAICFLVIFFEDPYEN